MKYIKLITVIILIATPSCTFTVGENGRATPTVDITSAINLLDLANRELVKASK